MQLTEQRIREIVREEVQIMQVKGAGFQQATKEMCEYWPPSRKLARLLQESYEEKRQMRNQIAALEDENQRLREIIGLDQKETSLNFVSSQSQTSPD
jgi:cell shape-determining protein MreC